MTDICSALHDLLNTDEDLEAVARRHFAEDYKQRTNGSWDDRAGFLEHIRHLRSVVQSVEIEVLDEFVSGTRYADRHVVTVFKNDGSVTKQEVYVFAQLDSAGKFTTLEEVTLMLTGDADDRYLGNAK